MVYGSQPATCPQCGTSADVLTVQEMFDLLNGVQDANMQQAQQAMMYGPPQRQQPRPARMDHHLYDDPAQDIAGAVIGAAGKLIGRAIGNRVRRTYEERIGPALDAQLAQARVHQEQSRSDQAAIVARYPDLYGCMRDEVVFLAGGSRVVPISQIPMPITLANADALVSGLRAP